MGVSRDPKGENAPVERFQRQTPTAQAGGQTDPQGRNATVARFAVRMPKAQTGGVTMMSTPIPLDFRRKFADRAAGAARPNRPGPALRAPDGRERRAPARGPAWHG